jgi:hypothetical protein
MSSTRKSLKTSSGSARGGRRPTSARAARATDLLDGPVDFSRFGPARRRAFAGTAEAGRPSLAALWEMPQLASGAVLLGRGRPRKGGSRPTTVRSVRLPEALWARMDAQARAKGMNLHQAMRAALLGWIRRAG